MVEKRQKYLVVMAFTIVLGILCAGCIGSTSLRDEVETAMRGQKASLYITDDIDDVEENEEKTPTASQVARDSVDIYKVYYKQVDENMYYYVSFRGNPSTSRDALLYILLAHDTQINVTGTEVDKTSVDYTIIYDYIDGGCAFMDYTESPAGEDETPVEATSHSSNILKIKLDTSALDKGGNYDCVLVSSVPEERKGSRNALVESILMGVGTVLVDIAVDKAVDWMYHQVT